MLGCKLLLEVLKKVVLSNRQFRADQRCRGLLVIMLLHLSLADLPSKTSSTTDSLSSGKPPKNLIQTFRFGLVSQVAVKQILKLFFFGGGGAVRVSLTWLLFVF